MNETQDYFKRAIPEPYRILGLQLLPLSLGRYRLLKRFNSPFVSDDETKADIADLLFSVVICSMRCDEFLELVNTGGLEREIRNWSRQICPHPWIGALPFVGKWWRANHSFNVIEKLQLFQRYIKEAQEIPPYRELESNFGGSGAHWSHGIEVTLRSEVGWGEEEIREQPLSKAIGDYFKLCENKGLLNLMTEWEASAPCITDGMSVENLRKLELLSDPADN